MTEKTKKPYGNMHLSDDQKSMLAKEQKYQNASAIEKAKMEELIYDKYGLVGESEALFYTEFLHRYHNRRQQKEWKEDTGLDKMNIERAMIYGFDPAIVCFLDGRMLPTNLPIWSGKQPDGMGGNKYSEMGLYTREFLNYPNIKIFPERTGKLNSINRSIEDIENFFDKTDTYQNLEILRDAIEGEEKHIGSYKDKRGKINVGKTKYFCELSRDSEDEKNQALAGLYDSFIDQNSESHSSPLIRLLTPSMAFSDKLAFEKRSWFTDSMLADYAFAKFPENQARDGYVNNDGTQFKLEAHPPEEHYSGSDFHNIMAHMFVRMAERFGMFDAKTQEDRDKIKDKVIRWEKYLFAGRAYEMLSNPNHLHYSSHYNDIMPNFEISKEDKDTLEEYCAEHLNSGFEAEREISEKLLEKLQDPELKVFDKDSRNSVMGLGYELRDNQDRPVEVQYAEKFHDAMINEGDKDEQKWAEKIDLKDDFDAILYGRYM